MKGCSLAQFPTGFDKFFCVFKNLDRLLLRYLDQRLVVTFLPKVKCLSDIFMKLWFDLPCLDKKLAECRNKTLMRMSFDVLFQQGCRCCMEHCIITPAYRG